MTHTEIIVDVNFVFKDERPDIALGACLFCSWNLHSDMVPISLEEHKSFGKSS